MFLTAMGQKLAKHEHFTCRSVRQPTPGDQPDQPDQSDQS